jgi:multiple sugar transport system permease protein
MVKSSLLSIRWRRKLEPLLFIGPAVLLLVALVIYPMVYSLIHSMQHWDLELAPDPLGSVGLRNYQRILSDSTFWSAAVFTIEFVVVAVGVELVLGTVLALLLDQRLPGTQLARTLIIMPTAVAPIVAGFMFRYMYYPGTGIIAYLASRIGLPVPDTGILGSTTWAPPGLEITDIWQWTPFVALVVLAGIQGVPQELIEAARVDGAGAVSLFWRIIVPQLRFIVAIVLIIRIMQTFNVFDVLFAETMGGPGTSTTSMSYLLYLNGLRYYNIGYAFAMAWIITALAVILVNAYILVAFRGIEV